MDCKKIHKIMADYLCDALPRQEADEVRRHIESCPACRAEA
ncbi:MAG: zf-HC2 domain-containing protein [Planctomycetota bacterium]